jgi:hypothetical protein
LWKDARLGDHGHEVVVTIPTRDDVAVEVRDAAARHGEAEVETDVESFGFHGGGKEALGENDFVKQVDALGSGELIEFGDFAKGNGEEVPGIVGKPIEDEIRKRSPVNDESGAIVAERRKLREGPLHLRRRGASMYSMRQ